MHSIRRERERYIYLFGNIHIWYIIFIHNKTVNIIRPPKAYYTRTCIGGQKEREIDFEAAIKEGSRLKTSSMGGLYISLCARASVGRKREREIDFELAIKEGFSMWGLYMSLWVLKIWYCGTQIWLLDKELASLDLPNIINPNIIKGNHAERVPSIIKGKPWW